MKSRRGTSWEEKEDSERMEGGITDYARKLKVLPKYPFFSNQKFFLLILFEYLPCNMEIPLERMMHT
jgi:hypothetical protein